MKKLTLRKKVLLLALLGTIGSGTVILWQALKLLKSEVRRRIAAELRTTALAAAPEIERLLAVPDKGALVRYCRRLATATGLRFTVVLPDGTVAVETHHDPALMDSHKDRPEIEEALSGKNISTLRLSRTLRELFLYAAVPIKAGGVTKAILRAAKEFEEVKETVRPAANELLLPSFCIIAAGAFMLLLFMHRTLRPLRELQLAAKSHRHENPEALLPVPEVAELEDIALCFNRSVQRFRRRLNELEARQRELEAVLASMAEGVIAVDVNERLVALNRKAAVLLDIDPGATGGRFIQEVIRSSRLQELIQEALSSDEPIEGEVRIYGDPERILEVRGTGLKDGRGRKIGALVVLNDVTRIRHLETVRRDFVANVSHQLRTPITAIKGFVETMRDGAVDNPKEARRFLDIIARQVNRLQAIIEDLLMLARLESRGEEARLQRTLTSIAEVTKEVLEATAPKARDKNIRLLLDGDKEVLAPVNATLLSHAIMNLLDNAIKYSDPGTTVRVSVRREGESVKISVTDQGCGIEKRHLERIFERFYRVDPTKSDNLGGTGLGLAIVKHIAEVHGGSVEVESKLGEGSSFTLVLPAAPGKKSQQGL
ncbi:hypothetical protein DRN74_05540 [Candidatus Micrarchaeota archaeon]|nr:MAG: hypothetical protein DRN74_05540 [Candidatus Micrarchaeota archaeon]